MKQVRTIMGMPVIVEVIDKTITPEVFEKVFTYLHYVDQTFSPYKADSEVSAINAHTLLPYDYSTDMKAILSASEETKTLTDGYFDITRDGKIDPSGIVKGWAIYNAAKILESQGFTNFCVEIAGDIEVSGVNDTGNNWKIGIRNPFKHEEIVKVISLSKGGVATSGTYEQGQHIYNPKDRTQKLDEVVSITVVGPNIFDADRFATAAFAMQREGVNFIERLKGFEAYMIDRDGLATETSGWSTYITE